MNASNPSILPDGSAWPAKNAQSSNAPRRLLVISNRAPIRIVREEGHDRIFPTVGGVGSTFLSLLERHGGLWIAWSGTQARKSRLTISLHEGAQLALLFQHLSERDVTSYYYGMCNHALWPLMHYLTLNTRFDRTDWDSYCRVNLSFARAALAEAPRYDVVWVQDFHLALVPRLLRERNAALPVGMFWHVPWPPEQVFRVLPWRRDFLAGMLGSDLIGFHTKMYGKHFLECCERILGLEVDRDKGAIYHDSRVTYARAFPLGIPAQHFRDLAISPLVRARARRIRKSLRSPIVLLGVDRLDYTKGIIERLLAFERFLELYPQYRRQITFLLIAVPSRIKIAEYAGLKRQLDELVGRVVGRFSSQGWVPIRYLYTQFNTEELVAYYQAADIALVTPLRDGMNLIAKEFVASQFNDSAVLILSEFAGAAEELEEALMVNPYDLDDIATRLKQAIEMPVEEKQRRLRSLRERVDHNNVERWSESFLSTLLGETHIPADAGILTPNN